MRLLDIWTPVRVVRWNPNVLRDDGIRGRGNIIQNPEGLVFDHCNVAIVPDGRPRDHQRVGPSWHVPDEIKNVSRVHLEQGSNEKFRISQAKHLDEETVEETVVTNEGDQYGLIGLIRHLDLLKQRLCDA